MNDQELLDQWCRNRDEAAFAQLHQRYGALVASVVQRRLGPGHPQRDDAQQAVWILLAQRAGDAPGQFLGPWLHRCATLCAGQALRSEQRRRYHERQGVQTMEESRSYDYTNPDQAAETAALRRYLDEAIQHLTQAEQAAVISHWLCAKPQAEVAAELGCTIAAVKMRLQSARKRLRHHLKRLGVGVSPTLLLSILQEPLSAQIGATMNPASLMSSNPLAEAVGPTLDHAPTAQPSGLSLSPRSIALGVGLLLALGLLLWGASQRGSEAVAPADRIVQAHGGGSAEHNTSPGPSNADIPSALPPPMSLVPAHAQWTAIVDLSQLGSATGWAEVGHPLLNAGVLKRIQGLILAGSEDGLIIIAHGPGCADPDLLAAMIADSRKLGWRVEGPVSDDRYTIHKRYGSLGMHLDFARMKDDQLNFSPTLRFNFSAHDTTDTTKPASNDGEGITVTLNTHGPDRLIARFGSFAGADEHQSPTDSEEAPMAWPQELPPQRWLLWTSRRLPQRPHPLLQGPLSLAIGPLGEGGSILDVHWWESPPTAGEVHGAIHQAQDLLDNQRFFILNLLNMQVLTHARTENLVVTDDMKQNMEQAAHSFIDSLINSLENGRLDDRNTQELRLSIPLANFDLRDGLLPSNQ